MCSFFLNETIIQFSSIINLKSNTIFIAPKPVSITAGNSSSQACSSDDSTAGSIGVKREDNPEFRQEVLKVFNPEEWTLVQKKYPALKTIRFGKNIFNRTLYPGEQLDSNNPLKQQIQQWKIPSLVITLQSAEHSCRRHNPTFLNGDLFDINEDVALLEKILPNRKVGKSIDKQGKAVETSKLVIVFNKTTGHVITFYPGRP